MKSIKIFLFLFLLIFSFGIFSEVQAVDDSATVNLTSDLTVTNNRSANVVTSSPANSASLSISCGSTACGPILYPWGELVTVTAPAEAGYTVEFSNGCTAKGAVGAQLTCFVEMYSAKTVEVVYTAAPVNYDLTVTNNLSTATVTGTSTPAQSNISCGATCGLSYSSGTKVTINAPAQAGFSVAISGGCTATGAMSNGASCEVTMDAVKTVAVKYSPYLFVTNNMASTKTVTTLPANINCGLTDCFQRYDLGAELQVVAPFLAGHSIKITGGGCDVTGSVGASATCNVTMDTAKTVAVEYVDSRVPTVTTASCSDITQTGATSGGNVTSAGGSAVTARGVVWNTEESPTTANSKTTNGTGTGSFTSSISGLTAGTTYYVRAYATNTFGTAYGNQVSCKTTDLTVTVDVNADPTEYNVIRDTSVSFTFSSTTSSTAGTECRLLDYLKNPFSTTYTGTNPTSLFRTVPDTVGIFDYYVQCRDRVTTSASEISQKIVVKTKPEVKVTDTSGGDISPDTAWVTYGTSPSYTISPNTNYIIDKVTVNGSTVASTSPYTFDPVFTDQTITATYKYTGTGPNVTLTASPNSGTPGMTSKLTWTTSNFTTAPTGCEARQTGPDAIPADWNSASKTPAAGGSADVTVNSTTTYGIACFNTNTGQSASGETTVTVGAKSDQAALSLTAQTITLPSEFSNPLQATGGSGTGAFSYAISSTAGENSAGCWLEGTGNSTLKRTNAGICVVKVNKAGDTNYNPATEISRTFTVKDSAKSDQAALSLTAQTITLPSEFSNPLQATGGSGTGAFSYAISSTAGENSAGCWLEGTTLKRTNAGICVVKVNKAGDTNYNPATEISVTFTVNAEAGVMSGTLTASNSSCEISLNQFSCPVNLTWGITNPETTPTAITASGMSNINVTNTLATPQSGTSSNVAVPYSSRTFYLYNNAKSLVPTSPSGEGVTVTSSCISNTVWNGSSCVCAAGTNWNTTSSTCVEATSTTGTISAQDCDIETGDDMCTTEVTWNVTNPIAGKTDVTIYVGNTLSTADSGTLRTTMWRGDAEFRLYNNGVLLDEDIANAECEEGEEFWDEAASECLGGVDLYVSDPPYTDVEKDNSTYFLYGVDQVTSFVEVGVPTKFYINSYNQGSVNPSDNTYIANRVAITDNPASWNVAYGGANLIEFYDDAGSVGTKFGDAIKFGIPSISTITFNKTGNHWVGACVDEDIITHASRVNESQERNNCSGWRRVFVSGTVSDAKPWLKVSSTATPIPAESIPAVPYNSKVTLHWGLDSGTINTACYLTGGEFIGLGKNLGNSSTGGTQPTSPLKKNTTYTIECDSNTVTDSVEVEVDKPAPIIDEE